VPALAARALVLLQKFDLLVDQLDRILRVQNTRVLFVLLVVRGSVVVLLGILAQLAYSYQVELDLAHLL